MIELKRILCILLLLVILPGCSDGRAEMDRAMALRSRLLAASGIRFDAVVTADYGDKLTTFSLSCETDEEGNLRFTVLSPESIEGITGILSATGGKLTFEDTALAFPTMADGQLSPVSAPWILLNTLRSGYLTSCALEEGALRLSIDDSYADDALHLDIWLDPSDQPARGEILWQGRRLLSVTVTNFTIL